MYRTSSKLASRPRPKVQPLVNRGPLPEFFRVGLKWAATWAVVGCIMGLLFMVGRVLPLAESGAKPSSVFGYVFWVPALTGGAAAAGLAIGLIFAGLMAVTTELRESLEDSPGMMARLGPDALCGAVAGLMAGLLVGGWSGALFFGALGAASGGILKYWVIRTL
jgi:hypothetical protein